MNTFEIIHILNKNPVTEKYFDGVYPVDHLEKINKRPRLIICNTDTSEGKGLHWIAIFFYNENKVDFFDSLGKNPSEYDSRFITFMKKFADECYLTKTRVQPINSDLCGHFCIYFSHKRCQGFNLIYILHNFPNPEFIKVFSEIYLNNFKKETNQKCQKCIHN